MSHRSDDEYWYKCLDCGKEEALMSDNYPKQCPVCGSENINHPPVVRGGPEFGHHPFRR